MAIMTLKGPTISAIMPGMYLPRIPIQFMIVIVRLAVDSLYPTAVTYDGKYVAIPTSPVSEKQTPSVQKKNAGSLSAEKSMLFLYKMRNLCLSVGLWIDFLPLGRISWFLPLTSNVANVRRAKKTNEIIRMAHAKLTLAKSLFKISGKMIPPTESPSVASAKAWDLLLRNQWLITAAKGPPQIPNPIPDTIPNDARNSDKELQFPVKNMPRKRKTVPNASVILGPSSSKAIPPSIETVYDTRTYTAKIIEVLEVETFDSWCF